MDRKDAESSFFFPSNADLPEEFLFPKSRHKLSISSAHRLAGNHRPLLSSDPASTPRNDVPKMFFECGV